MLARTKIGIDEVTEDLSCPDQVKLPWMGVMTRRTVRASRPQSEIGTRLMCLVLLVIGLPGIVCVSARPTPITARSHRCGFRAARALPPAWARDPEFRSTHVDAQTSWCRVVCARD